MAAVEAGIKTFLIADVRGYTRFTQERGDEAAARLATRFAELARESIEAAGGTLVELRGDEALAVFDSARQALRAAADLQARFVAETIADPSLPLAVGIGVDAGEAVQVDGGYRGGALNLAARLCSLAGPGEVLASPGVAHLARKVEGLEYVERGAVRLKGLEKPVEVVAIRPEREDVALGLAFRRALDPAARGALDSRNPYKGLRAFAEGDAEDFFGREALTEHLVTRLGETRFLAVVGPSGSGKSSVVRAGLVPRLRNGALPGSEHWYVVEMFPGAYPLEELEAALLRAADSAPGGLLEQLEQDELGLLRAVKRLLADDESELVLVVDQLEEVFTLVADEARRTQFLSVIERAVGDPHARLRVVVTLRADFYDRPLLYSGFADLLRDYVEALVPLKAEEFERAIVGPAERVGARFEPGLLAELVADVADEPGALPLLQYALTELYERREGSTLTLDAYRAMGGVSGALAGRAEEIYGGLGDAAQEAARQLFLRLVTLGEGVEDTRRRVERTELASIEIDQAALEEAIQEFGAWRLLSFDRDPRSGAPTIEVAHEALMREWERFRRWIDDGREEVRLHRRLAAAAGEWELADRESSYLLRGSNLAQFEPLADEATIAFTELERAFVAASRRANELELGRQRQQNRRLKALLAGAVALLALAIVAGALALVSRSNAQNEARVALGRELGAEAVSEPRIDLAMLLARESLRLDNSEATQGTLLTTLLRSPAAIGTFALPATERPQNVRVAADGRTIAVRTNSDLIRIYDTRTHRQVRSLPALPGDYLYLPHTRRLFLLDGNGNGIEYQLVDTASGRVIRTYGLDHRLLAAPGTTNALPVAATNDRRYVFLAYALLNKDGSDGAAYLDRWAVARGGAPETIPLRTRGLVAMSVTRDGRLLVASDDAIATWNPTTLRRESVVPVRLPEAPAALSPDGRTLAYGLTNGTLHFVDTATGRVTPGATAHAGAVGAVAFSPDSRLAVSGGDEGVAIVWNPRTGQPLQRLSGHATAIHDVAFSADGRTLYTSSLDGTVLQWDLGGRRRFGRSFGVAPWPPVAFTPPPLAVSPDGTRFAALDGASGIGIYSLATLRRIGSLTLPRGRTALAVAWSGRRLVVGDDRGGVRVYTDAGNPRLLETLRGLHAPAVAVAASDEGRTVAAAGVAGPPGQLTGAPTHGTLELWHDGRPAGRPVGLQGIIEGAAADLAFNRDGSLLAVAARNGPVLIVDPRTARLLRAIRPSRSDTAIAVAFAPDGTLATTSWAGILSLWNPRTGAQIGHSTPVGSGPGSLSFDPTGRIIAIAGDAVRLWSPDTEQQLGAALPGPAQPEWTHVAFTPDGRYLIVIPADGTAWRWPAATTEWAAHACAVAGRNFTQEEWRRFLGGRAYSRVCP